MNLFIKKTILIITLLLSKLNFAAIPFNELIIPNDLYLGFSGGYGESQQAFENTGTSSLLRIAFGSLWSLNPRTLIGGELGFQTGNQMRLSEETLTKNNGTLNAVPLYLNTKTPIDFLFVTKRFFNKRFFLEGKAGASLISAEMTNADIKTSNAWLAEVQAGLGFNLSDHSRLIVGYQQYFGKQIKIRVLNPDEGTLQASGIPTWQAFLFTVEIKV